MIYLTCTECDWQGSPDELVSLTEETNDKDFSYCPYCNLNDFEEDEEDDW